MFKPKHIAPFFSMTPMKFSEVLREVHIVYQLNQTPLGSFLLTEKDLPIIEFYLKTQMLFGNKKITRIHLKEYMERKEKEERIEPEWIRLIRK